MGFVLLPALVTDISAVYDVYFAAFKNNLVTRAFFPSASDEDLTNASSEFRKAHTAHTLQYWHTNSTQYTVKCIDTKTGNVVGMALWDVYLTPSDWRKGEISWLHGKELDRAEALVMPLWNAREKLWLNERYLYCHVIAVHPEFQRMGVGALLFTFGTNISRQSGLPIYIESSKDAFRLYEKMGCRPLRERPVHRAQDLWPEDASGVQEDREIDLFVWLPENGDGQLPKAVELA